MNKKYVITLGPQGLSKVLTKEDIKNLFDIVDKAISAGIKLELEYTEITNETPEDQKSAVSVPSETL